MGQRKRVPLMDQTRKVQSTCDDDNMPMEMILVKYKYKYKYKYKSGKANVMTKLPLLSHFLTTSLTSHNHTMSIIMMISYQYDDDDEVLRTESSSMSDRTSLERFL